MDASRIEMSTCGRPCSWSRRFLALEMLLQQVPDQSAGCGAELALRVKFGFQGNRELDKYSDHLHVLHLLIDSMLSQDITACQVLFVRV